MIAVEQALEKILAAMRPLVAESVSLKEAAAPRPLPPWVNTAMDASPAISVHL